MASNDSPQGTSAPLQHAEPRPAPLHPEQPLHLRKYPNLGEDDLRDPALFRKRKPQRANASSGLSGALSTSLKRYKNTADLDHPAQPHVDEGRDARAPPDPSRARPTEKPADDHEPRPQGEAQLRPTPPAHEYGSAAIQQHRGELPLVDVEKNAPEPPDQDRGDPVRAPAGEQQQQPPPPEPPPPRKARTRPTPPARDYSPAAIQQHRAKLETQIAREAAGL